MILTLIFTQGRKEIFLVLIDIYQSLNTWRYKGLVIVFIKLQYSVWNQLLFRIFNTLTYLWSARRKHVFGYKGNEKCI